MCYTSPMLPTSILSAATACVLLEDRPRRDSRPKFRLGRTLPWYVEVVLLVAAGPIAFKIAVAVFTWLDISL